MLYYELLLPVISGNEFNVLITLNTTPPNGVESSLAPWRNCVYYDYLFTLYLLSSVSLTHSLSLFPLSLSLSQQVEEEEEQLPGKREDPDGGEELATPTTRDGGGGPPTPPAPPSPTEAPITADSNGMYPGDLPPSPPPPQNHTSLLMSCWLDLTVVIVTAKQCLFGIVGIYM